MKITAFRLIGLCFAVLASAAVVGCQEGEVRETRKPVIEESTTEELQDSLEAAGDDLSEAAEAAADAVTPDEPIVDIRTPLGDVQVGEDPATGDTNVDVDTPGVDVDVDNE